MNKIVKLFADLSIHKTLFFNFKYFNFKTALKFPVFIGKNMILKTVSGSIILPESHITGGVRLGFESIGIFDKKRSKGIWELKGNIIFEGTAFLGQGTKLFVDEAREFLFGNNFSLTGDSQIISQKKIVFGKDCLISWDCIILDTDFHKIYNEKEEFLNPPKEIIIGEHVWIGCRSSILKGSKIPDHSILGAGSILSKELTEASCIYSGNPVKKLKENIRWEL
ncbi:MAG: acyltransferase [Cloacibacterium sp.]|uniref:acyltransferase n=1 Tax=Cloacibacterium sp. TaxID=1913682 RepID=UPI003C74634C